ncbi:MAG TPA: histidinol dehydrogenase [Xanthomonadaceae bacterium]|nr:histidinol dehydrogenase [Xanthomonadaceae bacterium]
MEIVDWTGLDAAARSAVLRRPLQAVADDVLHSVQRILALVKRDGDDALRTLSARFDAAPLQAFEVGDEEFDRAEAAVSPALREAMVAAAARIEAFHRAGMAQPYAVDTAVGVRCERVLRPIRRVGLYVPAGSAPLPSTALMLGVPARLAGCPQVVLCTPPRRDGSADPAVLVAAKLCGIGRVFKLGGAQAIAAMAYGTGSMPRCDKLFGPGNAYVTEAKRQVSTQAEGAAIDMPAGPSEVLVIADAGADAAFVAADLLSQAEHGPDSQVLLVSDDVGLLQAVDAELQVQLAALPRADIARQSLSSSRAILVGSLEDAFALSNEYAPEHLILALRTPREWLDRVSAAGSVFLGDWAPEALGDYCSGTNHVLPTGGAAHACSGVSVASFQKAITVQQVDRSGIAAIGPDAVTLAEAEGLDAHARAVSMRLVRARSEAE